MARSKSGGRSMAPALASWRDDKFNDAASVLMALVHSAFAS